MGGLTGPSWVMAEPAPSRVWRLCRRLGRVSQCAVLSAPRFIIAAEEPVPRAPGRQPACEAVLNPLEMFLLASTRSPGFVGA